MYSNHLPPFHLVNLPLWHLQIPMQVVLAWTLSTRFNPLIGEEYPDQHCIPKALYNRSAIR
jgi:hypothetical protein